VPVPVVEEVTLTLLANLIVMDRYPCGV